MRDKRQELLFRCINCMQRCSSLYYECGGVLVNAKNRSLKLNQCKVCHQTVDAYCERERILIVLDLILVRHEAYRHVLYNENTCSIQVSSLSKSLRIPFADYIRYFWKEIMLSSILRAYHVSCSSQYDPTFKLMEHAFEVRVADSETKHDVMIFRNFGSILVDNFITSLIANLVFGNVVIVFLLGTQKRVSSQNEKNHIYLQRIEMIAKAILWPQVACPLATACLGVWEYSSTTLSLGGTLLVIMYQWVALKQIILSLAVSTNLNVDLIETRKVLLKSAILATLILTAAVFVRAFSYYLAIFIPSGNNVKELTCPGLSFDFKFPTDVKQINLCMA